MSSFNAFRRDGFSYWQFCQIIWIDSLDFESQQIGFAERFFTKKIAAMGLHDAFNYLLFNNPVSKNTISGVDYLVKATVSVARKGSGSMGLTRWFAGTDAEVNFGCG